MRYTILHELPERLRINLRVPGRVVDPSRIEKTLLLVEGVRKASFSARTNNLFVTYAGARQVRDELLKTLSGMASDLPKRITKRPDSLELERKKTSVLRAGGLLLASPLVPLPIRPFLALYGAVPVFTKGVKSLLKRRLSVDVLDSSAVGAAIGMGDFRTAGIITFLLKVGDYLEEWTRERSRRMLSSLFAVQDEWAWVKKNGTEARVPLGEISAGDLVVARAGSYIPVDGVVADGEAMVNQSSMTGEPFPVLKRPGITVYAGTAVDEGGLIIRTVKARDETRSAQMVRVIQESEGLKADVQSHAERLADRVVPYTFLLSGFTFALTGNPARAASVLLVDYSCAVKLATPLAIMAGMIQSARKGVLIKGGKFIERLSRADTFILDKTGTLTHAAPRVVDVVACNGHSREFVLKNAACAEEHFPHPIATAVVRKAKDEGLSHEEEHAAADYVLAHGISTKLKGERLLVGSRHFIREDELIDTCCAETAVRAFADSGHSALYVAYAGSLAGVIAIEDPVRTDSGHFLQELRQTGVDKIVMLTGDGEAAARNTARALGIGAYQAEVFPEQKAEIIRTLKAEGRTVAMVGDGINDSPALSLADVGISMKHGADIAKEACDVLIMNENLMAINEARKICMAATATIKSNFRFIVWLNSALIGLGLLGAMSPAMSAFLHNSATVAAAARSLKPLRRP